MLKLEETTEGERQNKRGIGGSSLSLSLSLSLFLTLSTLLYLLPI